MDEAQLEDLVEDFRAFVRGKGFTEQQIRYNDLYRFLEDGTVEVNYAGNIKPVKIEALPKLFEEWNTKDGGKKVEFE